MEHISKRQEQKRIEADKRLQAIREKYQEECEHFIVTDDYGKEYCQECGKYKFIN